MKKGEVNWVIVGMILALVVLIILVVIFREQIVGIVRNFNILTPKNETVTNISQCLTNPDAPGCDKLLGS